MVGGNSPRGYLKKEIMSLVDRRNKSVLSLACKEL